jgi:hypothetical protein
MEAWPLQKKTNIYFTLPRCSHALLRTVDPRAWHTFFFLYWSKVTLNGMDTIHGAPFCLGNTVGKQALIGVEPISKGGGIVSQMSFYVSIEMILIGWK